MDHNGSTSTSGSVLSQTLLYCRYWTIITEKSLPEAAICETGTSSEPPNTKVWDSGDFLRRGLLHCCGNPVDGGVGDYSSSSTCAQHTEVESNARAMMVRGLQKPIE